MHRSLLSLVVAVAALPGMAAAEETALDQVTSFLTGSSMASIFVTEVLFVGFISITMLALFSDWTTKAVRNAQQSTIISFGLGIPGTLVLLGLLVVSLILIATFFGMIIGIPMLVVVGVLFFVWRAIGYLVVGGFIASRLGTSNVMIAAVVGALVAGVLALIPYAGPVITFGITALGVGASLRASWGSGGVDPADREVPSKHDFIS